jgi:hypothetical protein
MTCDLISGWEIIFTNFDGEPAKAVQPPKECVPCILFQTCASKFKFAYAMDQITDAVKSMPETNN